MLYKAFTFKNLVFESKFLQRCSNGEGKENFNSHCSGNSASQETAVQFMDQDEQGCSQMLPQPSLQHGSEADTGCSR